MPRVLPISLTVSVFPVPAGPAGAPILLRLAQLDPGSPGDTPAVSPSSSSREAPPAAARMVLNALVGLKPDLTDRGDTQSLHLDADAYLQMNDKEAWEYLQASIEQQQPSMRKPIAKPIHNLKFKPIVRSSIPRI